ncbi:MAG TPA: adenylate/guanylate cyclase domain-containing protein [Vicinamibacterales bacterium]|jgi:class 3 adenylate cyclase|nr:adenylate/guanylate cyclase domain-containing protein [Vicinamibacterales bacterium]
MARPQAKNLRSPDQVRQFPNGRIANVSHGETTIGRFVFQPGWRWSRDVGPIAGTRSCQIHHQGVVLRGRLLVESDTGEVCEFGVDDVYDIPPGHDASVPGDEPFEAIEFASARLYAAPAGADRVLAAMLCTDIVDSTEHLRRLGDSAWRELLLEHNHQVRLELNSFRGREIQTTGDGFLAVFDGPARAVRCARSISRSISRLGVAIRAGVHTGEVEFVGDNVRGLAVHETARVAGVARAGEVLVSATTKHLLEGSGIAVESAGVHELKGLGEARELFRIVGSE